MPEDLSEPRLTALAHGGGCGCKIAPSTLRRLLADAPFPVPTAALLVGPETSDDAAVWKLNDRQALVATTDFFTPIVDDPFDLGRIAATNALSDVYAMGARPIFALALLGMPLARLSEATIAKVLAGGADVCATAGVPIAGGHSIDSLEPIYGLVALGLVDPDAVLTNRRAQAGDALILTKPLGVGVLSAAFRQGRLSPDGYRALIASTTRLNDVGARLSGRAEVRAMTDVTGFGLLGHAREMAAASEVEIELDVEALPILAGALDHLRAGIRTGASARNAESLEDFLHEPAGLSPLERDLLCDPQTSGGLLIACDSAAADRLLAEIRAAGFAEASVVGRVRSAAAGLRVRSAGLR